MKKMLLLFCLVSLFESLIAQHSSIVQTLSSTYGFTVKIETSTTEVKLTITGQTNRYLAIGFGGSNMANTRDAFAWADGAPGDYTMSGGYSAPSLDATTQNWTIIQDNVVGTTRTIVAKRTLAGNATELDYEFPNEIISIPIIYAVGIGTGFSYHATRGIGDVSLSLCNVANNQLPSTNSLETISIAAGNNIVRDFCSGTVSSILPTGGATAISGPTTVRTWIETTQPTFPTSQFVKRHYEITPTNNPSTATGRVTLYFTQQEFNDFNAVSSIDLPIDATDNVGKANLRIEKRSGVSNNGTGLPNSYTGTVETIDPADTDIVFNATDNRWEVSFDVTGFSGFFAKTRLGALPIKLINFSLVNRNQVKDLFWSIENSGDIRSIELQGGIDAVSFSTVASFGSTSQKNFSFSDKSGLNKYFRLKMTDQNGEISYSKILNAGVQNLNEYVQVYPSPANKEIQLRILNAALIGTNAILLDMRGAQMKRFNIQAYQQKIDVSDLAAGTYMLQFEDGSLLKFVKQ